MWKMRSARRRKRTAGTVLVGAAVPVVLVASVFVVAACATKPIQGGDIMPKTEQESSSRNDASRSVEEDIPIPEATVVPDIGALSKTNIPDNLSITVLLPGSNEALDPLTKEIVTQIKTYAQKHNITSITYTSITEVRLGNEMQDVIATEPDIIVGVGEQTISTLAPASASNLAQEFLLIGAQLPEPTQNVTAIIWPGARSRGFGSTDKTTATKASSLDYSANAVMGGIASVVQGKTGIVLEIP